MSGDLTLDASSANYLRIDPVVPLDVTLPAEESSEGLFFRIYNIADAAEALTVKNDGGDTIETFSQNEHGLVGCDGRRKIYVPGHT